MSRQNIHNCLRAFAIAAALAACALAPALAASHREAPLMTLDPAADISDFYAFVSYDAANLARAPEDRRVTFILNAVPGQEPGSGPNYFSFDDNVLYQIKIDNDKDGADDIRYEFHFQTETVTPDQFLATLALPPVTALEGPGSEGLSRKQRYTVTEVRDCKNGKKGCVARTQLFQGRVLSAVPSNIGPATTPNYEALAAQGIYSEDSTGIRVFAGQRAETFAIDLGAVFDTLNLRVENATVIAGVRPPLPVQTAAEDADDTKNPFGVNTFSGFNINTIAIEVPIKRLTKDGQPAGASNGTIGAYASTSRRKITIRRGEPGGDLNANQPLLSGAGEWRQVSRMANPLVNELIISIGFKDLWNATEPENEAQFLRFYRNLAVAQALQLVSGVPVPPAPREDIVRLLTKYAGQNPDPNVGPFSELLRLDMTVPPTPPATIKRLGPFAHDPAGNPTPTAAGDPAGFPNGRRPNDDVTDIVVRVAGGPNYIANFVGDGVGINEKGVTPDFPFLPTPYDGRNRRHIGPGETP